MPDREKVIKGLECCTSQQMSCKKDCPYNTSEEEMCTAVFSMMGDALGLLKEQERKPVKPEVERSGGGTTWWNVCGACKTAINPNDKYCHECGVSIDWERNDA